MNMYGSLYSNLRVYYSKDFPKFNPDEMINQNESGHELQEENKEEDKEMNKEGGDRE